jgi:hypothetical protein
MSEPSQLVVRVALSAERLAAFRAAAPAFSAQALAWEPWLGSQKYYGDPITLADVAGPMSKFRAATVGAFLDALVANDEMASSLYDEETQEWTLVVVEFSENYGEYIQALIVLAMLASFKDSPAPGYALIFGHLYEDSEITALMKIEAGSNELLSKPDSAALAFVEAAKDLVDDAIA